jgi:threonine/homoserine/homoserine lactone efflux protein
VPDESHLAAFLAAAAVLAALPGPGMLYVLARTVAGGRAAGIRSIAGMAAGGGAHVVAAALGLSALLLTSATAFETVKLIGAGYLIVLGLRTVREARHSRLAEPSEVIGEHVFRQGLVTEALNPKTALFFLTFLPQFCQPENGPVVVQVLVLGATSVALNTLVDVSVALAAGGISRRLRHRPAMWRRQQVATGSILIGLGAYAALAGHRTST